MTKPEIVIDECTGREVVQMQGSRGLMTLDPYYLRVRPTDAKLFTKGGSLTWPEEVEMAKFWFVERGIPETLIIEIGGE